MQLSRQSFNSKENTGICRTNLKCIVANNPERVEFDLNDGPHLLIYGMTGTGKTTYIQSLLATLLTNNGTDVFKVLIYDSRMSEYRRFYKISNLLSPIATDKQHFVSALNKLCTKVGNKERSYDVLVIIDDYADIASDPEIVERIIYLLKEGRTSGVHFIIATSMPYAKVLSSEIKANIPYVISFAAPSKTLSRMVLGENGAETLGVPGEIYFKKYSNLQKCIAFTLPVEKIETIIQTASIPSHKLGDLANVAAGILQNASDNQTVDKASGFLMDDNPLFDKMAQFVVETQQASTSILQRRFGIGYNRAAQTIDLLEEKKIIGPFNGATPRKVLMDLDKYNQVFNGIVSTPKNKMHLTNQSKIGDDGISLEIVDDQLKITESAPTFDQLSILPRNQIEEAKKHYSVYELHHLQNVSVTYTTNGDTIQKLVYHAPSIFNRHNGYISIGIRKTENDVAITLSGETYKSKAPQNMITINFDSNSKDKYRVFITILSNDTKLPVCDK